MAGIKKEEAAGSMNESNQCSLAVASALCGPLCPQIRGIFESEHHVVMPIILVSSLLLSVALSLKEVKHQQNYSDNFRKTFLPNGQPLLPGAFMRRPDLADLLDLLGSGGVSAFYSGNVTEEIISEVSPLQTIFVLVQFMIFLQIRHSRQALIIIDYFVCMTKMSGKGSFLSFNYKV